MVTNSIRCTQSFVPRRLVGAAVVLLALAACSGCRPGVVWSPDSKSLALTSRGGLQFFHVAEKRFEKLPAGAGKALNPAWSPDGSRLAFYRLVAKAGKIISIALAALDLKTRKEIALVPRLEPPGADAVEFGPSGGPELLVEQQLSLAWSPDGKLLAYVGYVKGRCVLHVMSASGGGARRIPVASADALSPTWSPDSARLAFFVEPVEAPGPRGIPAPHHRLEVWMADAAGTARRLWLPPDGSDLNPVPQGPQWAPDGRSVGVVAEKTGQPQENGEAFPELGRLAEVWEIPLEGAARKLTDVPGAALFATVSPGCREALFFRAAKKPDDPLEVALLTAPFGTARTLFRLPALFTKDAANAAKQPELEMLPVPVLSPDGKTVAVSLAEKAKPTKLWVAPSSGGPATAFTALP